MSHPPHRPGPVPLPPLTDGPVPVAQLHIGDRPVTAWADRPARGLTRVLLTDPAGCGCGDAHLRGDTLTVTLPDDWPARDRLAATCLIAHLIHGHRGGLPSAPVPPTSIHDGDPSC